MKAVAFGQTSPTCSRRLSVLYFAYFLSAPCPLQSGLINNGTAVGCTKVKKGYCFCVLNPMAAARSIAYSGSIEAEEVQVLLSGDKE